MIAVVEDWYNSGALSVYCKACVQGELQGLGQSPSARYGRALQGPVYSFWICLPARDLHQQWSDRPLQHAQHSCPKSGTVHLSSLSPTRSNTAESIQDDPVHLGRHSHRIYLYAEADPHLQYLFLELDDGC